MTPRKRGPTPAVVDLRKRWLRDDEHVKLVEGQRRYRILVPPGLDPIQVYAATTTGTHGTIVVVGGELVQIAGPYVVVPDYDLDADTHPSGARLRCQTCGWVGKRRTWPYRRLMVGDSMTHECVK